MKSSTTSRMACLAFATVIVASAAPSARAQSAQPVSLQVSVLGTSIGRSSSSVGGIGVEPQLRFNRVLRSEGMGALSVGIGGQWTKHTSGSDELTISGGFIEPRWVPPVSFAEGRVFPYVSARLAMLRQSNNFGASSGGTAFGGGGGLAIVLGRQLNLDFGFALVQQKFDDIRLNNGGTGSFESLTAYAAKAGFSYGFGK